MKIKSLTYNIERHDISKMVDNRDFTAFLEMGRMLNALTVAADSCREVYDERDTGYRSSQAASFLGRLNDQMLKLVSHIWNDYADEEFFAHFKDMFAGEIRSFPDMTVNRLARIEFRLISHDESVSKALRQLDVFGIDILFPSDRAEQVDAFNHEAVSQFEFGRYSVIRPKDRLELQYLVRNMTVIHDFAIGAEMFLKAMAKKLGFKPARGKSDQPAPDEVRAVLPKWYNRN
jgi:hypothetical protein